MKRVIEALRNYKEIFEVLWISLYVALLIGGYYIHNTNPNFHKIGVGVIVALIPLMTLRTKVIGKYAANYKNREMHILYVILILITAFVPFFIKEKNATPLVKYIFDCIYLIDTIIIGITNSIIVCIKGFPEGEEEDSIDMIPKEEVDVIPKEEVDVIPKEY